MKTALLALPLMLVPLFAAPAHAAHTSRRDAVKRAYAHADARGWEQCRVEAIVDVAGAVRVSLRCAPQTVVVVVREERVVREEVVAYPRPRPRPRPAPPPRETIVVVDNDCDSDSDSDSDRKKRHRHHDRDDDSDSDSD